MEVCLMVLGSNPLTEHLEYSRHSHTEGLTFPHYKPELLRVQGLMDAGWW